MVTEFSESPIVGEPIVETIIPTVEVPNIWAVMVDNQAEQTDEDRINNKRKNKMDKLGKKNVQTL